jgi:hypothetical protein
MMEFLRKNNSNKISQAIRVTFIIGGNQIKSPFSLTEKASRNKEEVTKVKNSRVKPPASAPLSPK